MRKTVKIQEGKIKKNVKKERRNEYRKRNNKTSRESEGS